MSERTRDNGSPTVVRVQGALADGSSRNGVIERLQAKGVKVTPPANPLRGISGDSAYIASLLDQIPGPVVAVGHSYRGAGSDFDGANADGKAYAQRFSGPWHRLLEGIGHNVPQEAPDAFADAILGVGGAK